MGHGSFIEPRVGTTNCTIAATGATAPCSWTPEESEVESCEHQDNANIHCQPFPESVSEERDIYTDYDGCHRHRVKHSSYLSVHFSQHSQGHVYQRDGNSKNSKNK
jgi:hypothetical protein